MRSTWSGEEKKGRAQSREYAYECAPVVDVRPGELVTPV